MNYRIPQGPPGGPLARFIGAVLGIAIMIGLFFLGFFVFVAAAGVALVVFLVFYLRFWWLTRKGRRQQRARQGSADSASQRPEGGRERRGSVTLEGEFEERDRDQQ
ncbi:MAG: hypothetical protein R3217_09520 [Gammaproteobacteria bacterium]|nr:hypothetical protein [Gammaproteobacteria bacterium]